MADFIERTHDVPGPTLVSGDMNARPGSFVYRQFTDRGWLDTYLEAGNPECDSTTGAGCTSGRNVAAQACYRGLGYERVGDYGMVFYDPA